MTKSVFPDHTGLVLEGGGMRGVFTSGVLDCFMDRGITFPYCVSVSAGACNGLSFKSRQRGRAKITNIDMLAEHRYIGMKYLWTQHSILDQQLIYDAIPNTLLPFDYDACFRNPMEFEMVTTDCVTGKAHYLTEHQDPQRLLQGFRLQAGYRDEDLYRKDSRGFRSVVLVISQFRDRGQNNSSVPFLFYRYRMKSLFERRRFIPLFPITVMLRRQTGMFLEEGSEG